MLLYDSTVMAPPNAHFAHCTQHPVLSPSEIKYILKSIQIDSSGWTDLEYSNLLEGLMMRVNTKFAHQPKLTQRTFFCALHNAKGIGPVFDTEFLRWTAEEIAKELREAKAKKGQGVS